MLVSFPAQESRSRFKVHRTQTSSLIMCGSIEVDVWRARIGIFAARIASRLPKGWRKIKRQVASMLFTQCVFAGGGACSPFGGRGSGYKREARLLAVLMSLLLATSVLNVSLLLRCGDVESNPGPGRYSDLDYNSVDSSKVLGEDDLRDVMSEIITVKARSLAIGRTLGLRMGELDSIQSSSQDHELQLNNVVCVWLRQRYNVERFGAPTWRKLVEAIDDPAGANDHRLAKIIAQHHPVTVSESVCGYGRGRGRGHGQRLAGYNHGARGCGQGRGAGTRQVEGALAVSNWQQEPPQKESKFEYRQILANFYLQRIDDQAWPPVKVTNFINLALIKDHTSWRETIQGSVDDVIGEKEGITYHQIFDDLTKLKFILFQGRPGSGKTTLMTKISQDWANNLFLGSTLLFFIPLRRLNTFHERTLATLIRVACPPFKPDEITSLVRAIQKIDGKNVIFIFDGFDEYSPISHDGFDEYLLISDDIVLSLMDKSRNFLRDALIVVSSRPAACQDFRRYADKQIEVVGFLKEHVIHYIQSYYYNDEQKAEDLLRHLELHPNLMNMCYLPLHCAMLVFLYDGTAILPQTETEFYKHFTISMLLRSQCKREGRPGYRTSLTSFDQLPPKDKIIFDKVCKLAFRAIVARKQVFMRSELQEIAFESGSTGSDDSCLGLIVIDRYFMRFGLDETYTFLHLTFQEFLAAVYMAGLPSESINYDIGSAVYHRFLCGLLNFKLPRAMEVFKRIQSRSRSNYSKYLSMLALVRCAYESQSQLPYNYILEIWNGCVKLDVLFQWEVSDGPAIASLLNNKNARVLEIEQRALLLGGVPSLPSKDQLDAVFSLIDNKALQVSVEITVEYRIFMNLTLTTELARELKKSLVLQECIETARVGSQKTVTLNLDMPERSYYETVKLCFQHPGCLLSLKLCGQIPSEDVIHYLRMCTDSLDNLRPIMVFSDAIITVFTVIDVVNEGSSAFEFNSTKNQELHIPGRHIQISGSQSYFLPEDYAKSLCDALHHTTDLCKIRIFGLQVSEVTLFALIKSLKCCPNLLFIDLGDIKLNSSGAQILGETLKHCCKVEKLMIDENGIGDAGFQALMPGLQSCTQLQQLIMHNNGLTDVSVPHLIKLVQSNRNLTMLGLCNNDITEVGYSRLKTAMLETEVVTIDHYNISFEAVISPLQSLLQSI